MSLFLDTSALYPLLVRTEEGHDAVAGAFREAVDEGRTVVTTNYVALETIALLQSRIGLEAVADLSDRILPLARIRWVDEALHRRAVEELVRRDRRRVSLTVSFLVMQADGIREALALDGGFEERGFDLLPGPTAS